MTFTYAGTLTTDLDNVRFNIGDVTDGSGIRPDGSNFTDEELGGLITREGSWQRATAAAFETLAAEWARFVEFSIGPRRENLAQTALRYRDYAKDWRKQYGVTTHFSKTGSRAVTRVDGYSDDIAQDET